MLKKNKDNDLLKKYHKCHKQIQNNNINEGIFNFLSLLDEIEPTHKLYYATLLSLAEYEKYTPKEKLEQKALEYFKIPIGETPKQTIENLYNKSLLKVKLSDINQKSALDYLNWAKIDLDNAETLTIFNNLEKDYQMYALGNIYYSLGDIELKETKHHLKQPNQNEIQKASFDFDNISELLSNSEIEYYDLEFGSPELNLLTHCYKKIKKANIYFIKGFSLIPNKREIEEKSLFVRDLIKNPCDIIFSDMIQNYDLLNK
jgi:hypothetical protein